MNDPLHKVESLAARARREETPGVEVADDVIRAIRSCEPPDAPFYSALKWVAAISGAGAAAGIAVCISVYSSMSDPLVAAFIDGAWGLL